MKKIIKRNNRIIEHIVPLSVGRSVKVCISTMNIYFNEFNRFTFFAQHKNIQQTNIQMNERKTTEEKREEKPCNNNKNNNGNSATPAIK